MYERVLYRIDQNKKYTPDNCGFREPKNQYETQNGIEVGKDKPLNNRQKENIKFLKRKHPYNVQNYKLWIKARTRNGQYS
jgi:hypothetical protein